MNSSSQIVVDDEIQIRQRKKMIFLVGGGVLGLLTGIGGAYLLLQRAEKKGELPQVSAMEGVKIGVMVFGLLRQIVNL